MINIKSISVRVDADNMGAITLYEKSGFSKVRGNIVMERHLVDSEQKNTTGKSEN